MCDDLTTIALLEVDIKNMTIGGKHFAIHGGIHSLNFYGVHRSLDLYAQFV